MIAANQAPLSSNALDAIQKMVVDGAQPTNVVSSAGLGVFSAGRQDQVAGLGASALKGFLFVCFICSFHRFIIFSGDYFCVESRAGGGAFFFIF